MLRQRFVGSAFAAAGLAAVPAVARAAVAQLSAAQRTPIEVAVAKAMAAAGAVGVSVTVARAGEIVYANGFGLRDIGTNLAVDADTIFPIGSITKQFTAAAIMLLVRDRRVELDAKAATYVPLAPHAQEYTVRQLLQQTTGLSNLTSVPGFMTEIATSSTITPEGLTALVGNAPLAFAPGTQFAYSNTNYVVLGMIIEAVARIPYARFVRERIAGPLGLTHLTYGPPPAGADVTRGYERATGGTAVTPWTPQATYAAGALYATPADLVRWDEAFFGGRLLDAATVQLMTTPPHLPGGAATTYAMGWIRDAIDGHVMIWHNGGVLGASTRNAYFPDQRLSVIVFANTAALDESRITREAFRAVVPPTREQLAAERARATTPAPGEDPAITAAVRAEYEAWRAGKVDATRYDPGMQALITPSTLLQISATLTGIGAPEAFVYTGKTGLGTDRGTQYRYHVVTATTSMNVVYTRRPDGKIGGLLFQPAE